MLAEWPLALFTVFTQMSVGAFVTLGFIQVLGRSKYDVNVIDRVSTPTLFSIGPLMVISLLLTLFHLGSPLNAPNAILHWASSWLSREILFVSGFVGLGFLFFIMQWRRFGSPTLRTIVAAFTAVWGLVFVWVTANVYMIRTVPAWNSWTTVAQFFLTTLILGCLSVGVALVAYRTLEAQPWVKSILLPVKKVAEADDKQVSALVATSIRWIGVAATVGLVLHLVVSTFVLARPEGPNPPETAFSMPLFWVQLLLLIIGAGILALTMSSHANWLIARGQETVSTKVLPRLTALAVSAFVLCLASQILWRFMFYGMMNRIGI